jgi:hypothetical protein
MPEATQEERDKIVELIKAGRVTSSEMGQRYWDRAGSINTKDPDFTVVEVSPKFWGEWEKTSEDGEVRGNQGGVEISWSTVSAGFGSLTLFVDKNGKLKADTEGMGKEFCKQVLLKLIEQMETDDA